MLQLKSKYAGWIVKKSQFIACQKLHVIFEKILEKFFYKNMIFIKLFKTRKAVFKVYIYTINNVPPFLLL